MQGIAALLIAIVLWLPLVALNAWAIEKIWNWYIPHIFQVQNIVFEEAVGLALIVSFLTHQTSLSRQRKKLKKIEELASSIERLGLEKSKKEDLENLIERILILILLPLFAVLAAVVYLWVWPLSIT